MDERSQLVADLRRALGDGEEPGTTLRDELAFALRLHAVVAGNPETLADIDAEVDAAVPLHAWLHDLPYELAEEGLVDEAVGLCARLSSLVDAVRMRGARARILAATGRCARACAEADELLAALGAGIRVLERSVCG